MGGPPPHPPPSGAPGLRHLMDGMGWQDIKSLRQLLVGKRIRRFAALSRNARTLACVGNRLSSPKVRHCLQQQSTAVGPDGGDRILFLVAMPASTKASPAPPCGVPPS